MVFQSFAPIRSAEHPAKAAVHRPLPSVSQLFSAIVGDRRPDLLVEQPPPFVGPLVEQRQVHHGIRQARRDFAGHRLAGPAIIGAHRADRALGDIILRAAWARSAALVGLRLPNIISRHRMAGSPLKRRVTYCVATSPIDDRKAPSRASTRSPMRGCWTWFARAWDARPRSRRSAPCRDCRGEPPKRWPGRSLAPGYFGRCASFWIRPEPADRRLQGSGRAAPSAQCRGSCRERARSSRRRLPSRDRTLLSSADSGRPNRCGIFAASYPRP
jgi:hypothetical protein